MPIQLSSDQVWQAIEKELFAVLGMVTARARRAPWASSMHMRDPEQARGRAPAGG